MECKNCFTKWTSQWRHGHCNACATYFGRHCIHKDIDTIYAKILMDLKNKNLKIKKIKKK